MGKLMLKRFRMNPATVIEAPMKSPKRLILALFACRDVAVETAVFLAGIPVIIDFKGKENEKSSARSCSASLYISSAARW